MNDLLNELNKMLPTIVDWAEAQEEHILKNGVPLDDDQKIDAYLVGVKAIEKVRLMKVQRIPLINLPEIQKAVIQLRILSASTRGITFGHGIYIRQDVWNSRCLIIHELAHTMQYERYKSFNKFLQQYINECIQVGYPNGELEREAIKIEEKLCW